MLASPALARLLVHFIMRPNDALHFQALKRATMLPNRSLQLELARLQRLGLLAREPEGRLVRFRVRSDDDAWRTLRDVVRRFVEPAEVLRVALAETEGVAAAFVFGSFARREGVHRDSDVDLFVLSASRAAEPARRAVASAVLDVSALLDREVNVSAYTPQQLAKRIDSGTAFTKAVLGGAKDWVIGDWATFCKVVPAARHITASAMSA